MRSFISLLRSNIAFLLPHAVLLLLSSYYLFSFNKEDIHLAMNVHYSAFGDKIMPWITWLGDGIVVTVLVLLLFALNRNFAFFTGIACLFTSGITQLLKHTWYYGVPRPAFVFTSKLHYVNGVINAFYDTFPSGHSTLAFSFYMSLCIGTNKQWLKFIFFLMAALVAYSRIYLSQHFLEDTFAGSIIGVIPTLLIFAIAKGYDKVKLPALTFSK